MKTQAVLRLRRKPRGIALVVVLAILALILITVVAFLTTAALERGTARAFSNTYQAKLAAESGLAAAMQTFSRSPAGLTGAGTGATENDLFVVVRAESTTGNIPYYAVGLPKPLAPGAPDTTGDPMSTHKVDYLPLVSGGVVQNDIDGDKLPKVDLMLPPPYAPATHADVKVFPGMTAPSAKWVTVEAPKTVGSALPPTRTRYAYWVEDLGGYLDVGFDADTVKYPGAGNADGPGSIHKRPIDDSTLPLRYKSSPKELALFTLFSNSAYPDPGTTQARKIIEDRPLLLTAFSTAQATAFADAPKYMAGRYFYEDEPVLIPRGFGYADEGKDALAINGLLTAAGVVTIANKITTNLPRFATTRRGGLQPAVLDYNKTIAASIIDYADSDGQATAGADFRGIDAYPLVSEIYNSKWWKRTFIQGGTHHVEIVVETWVELWNMSNHPASGSVEFTLKENHPVTIGFENYTFEEAAGPNHTITYPNGQSISVSMQPNEYKVLKVQQDSYIFDSGVSPPLTFPPASSPALALLGSNTASKYEMRWSGTLVDRSNGGTQRIAKSLRQNGTQTAGQRWSGSLPGFSHTNGSAFYNNLGDPRAAFHLSSSQAANAYDINASMPGRNRRNGISTMPSTGPDYKEVRPSSWPDRGHDSPVGNPPGSETVSPTASSMTANASMAPVYLANRGSYLTMAELGNIYDPAEWDFPVDGDRKWSDIPAGTAATASPNFGGGMTLRIGRPEFTRFDVPGVRASQLLDIFTTETRITTRGKVNLNTASRDVLRALGGGVKLNRDPDIKPPSLASDLTAPSGSQHADVFADAVIAARPFLSPAQLSGLKVPNPSTARVFGDPKAYGASGPSEWNDASTEEYFAKVYPLSSVRSRNFRIFVTGQVIDRNNRPVATAHRVYQIQVQPQRDSTGKITGQTIKTVYEGSL